MASAALVCLSDTAEEVIFLLLLLPIVVAPTVAAHFLKLFHHELLDLTLHAFSYFGDLGVVILIQPDETKHGAEGRIKRTFLILQGGLSLLSTPAKTESIKRLQ